MQYYSTVPGYAVTHGVRRVAAIAQLGAMWARSAQLRVGRGCHARPPPWPTPPPSTPPPRRHFTFTPSARSIRHTDPFSFLTDFARGISNLPPCWRTRTWTLQMYLTLDPPSERGHGEIRSLLSPAPTAQRPPSRGGGSNELNDLDSSTILSINPYANIINQPLYASTSRNCSPNPRPEREQRTERP